jgi:hypothetical protein
VHGISLDAHRAGATRWVGAGHSLERDPARAGREAVGAATGGKDARLVLLFASAHYDLGALAAAAQEQAPRARVVGCSTAAELATSAPSEAHVTALALGGPGFAVATAAASIAQHGPHEAAAVAADCVYDLEPGPHRAVLLLSDGLEGDPAELVRGAYAVVGAEVPLVGGCTGDTVGMRPTGQIHDGRALTGHVVAVALASDAPIGIGVGHACVPRGEPMLVTSARGRSVLGLDGRPALDVYLERAGAPEDARTDAAAFARFAATRPLGLLRRDGTPAARTIAAADFDERSIRSIAAIPEGERAWMMDGEPGAVLAATDAACEGAHAGIDGERPLAMVAFDGVGRRAVLGKTGVSEELDRIARCGGGAPLAGFYTYGGIARTNGSAGFHNQALVLLALS